MSLQDLPIVGRVLAFGPDDPVYDALILAGPIVVMAFAVGGRNVVTVAVAAGYVGAFIVYVAHRAAEARRR